MFGSVGCIETAAFQDYTPGGRKASLWRSRCPAASTHLQAEPSSQAPSL